MKQFHAGDFLRHLVDDVASSERAGKKFEADAAILGSLQAQRRRVAFPIPNHHISFSRYRNFRFEYLGDFRADFEAWRVRGCVADDQLNQTGEGDRQNGGRCRDVGAHQHDWKRQQRRHDRAQAGNEVQQERQQAEDEACTPSM